MGIDMIIPNKEMLKRYRGFTFPLDIILLSIYCKCRFSLSYRDLEELNKIRGLNVDHSTINRWVLVFAPLMDLLFRKRKKPVCTSWRMDETYIKINGAWNYLYRALDKYGYTVDFLLQKHRDGQAAKAFFRKAFRENNVPFIINIDKSGANKAALEEFNKELGAQNAIEIRQSKYLNNIVEQDHRFIKKRIKPMLWLRSYEGASATIAGIELVQMIKKGQLQRADENMSTYEQFVSLAA